MPDGCSISILSIDKAHDTDLPASHSIRHRIGVTELAAFLDSPEYNQDSAQQRHIFVVEQPASEDQACRSRLEGVLQCQLQVPSILFKAHQWTQTMSPTVEAIHFPRLPTAISPHARFSLEYFELWQVEDHAFFDRHIQGSAGTVTCAATGRPIQCHKWSKNPGWLLIAPRKCSFWSKKHGSGWTAVILCDLPPRSVRINNEVMALSPKPFDGGYHGFIPDNLKDRRDEAPPHNSFFNDVIYYLEEHADLLHPIQGPAAAAMFVKKIVASHYCQLLGFVSYQTPSMRATGWAVDRRTQKEIDESNQVEMAWSHFKGPEYFETLCTVLDALGISQGPDPFDVLDLANHDELDYDDDDDEDNVADPSQPKPEPTPSTGHAPHDWRSSTPDFLYLHREFRQRLAEYARMTSSLAALNGMIGGRISILEARTAKSLTLVAMLFAPPACVASIFSIPASIFPKNGLQLWWYWAAALPLTILVFILTYLIHERDVVKRSWRARRPKVPSEPPVPSAHVRRDATRPLQIPGLGIRRDSLSERMGKDSFTKASV